MSYKKLNLNTVAYRFGLESPISCASPLKVGQAVNDSGAFSSLRPAQVLSATKVSYAAAVIDRLFTGGYAFAKIDDKLYMEHADVVAVMSGNTINSNGTLTPDHIMTMYVVKSIADGTNKELAEIFANISGSITGTGRTSVSLIARFCDSLYYGGLNKNAEIEIGDELNDEEIDALVRGAAPKSLEFLKQANVEKPKRFKVEAPKKKTEAPKVTTDDVIKKCLDGEYILPYSWSEDQKVYCQDISSLKSFIPNKTFVALLNKISTRENRVIERMRSLDLNKDADRVAAIGNDYINVTLSGKPGTGKTRLAYALSAATGMPVYTISCSHNTDEDEFQGLTKMVDGKPTSVATSTVSCYENGGILLLEEINLPQAAVIMGALGQAVEFPFILKKDGYIPIRRHPLCVIISTMNTGTAGSKVLSQPFANRFKQSFVLDDPEKEDFIRILMNTGAERAVCRWVYECYERVVACIEDDNAVADTESILLSLSMRSCMGAIENIQEGMEPREAVINSIIGKIAEQDREVAESCRKVVLSMREPNFD